MNNQFWKRALALLLAAVLLGCAAALADTNEQFVYMLPEGAVDMTQATFSEKTDFVARYDDAALVQMSTSWLDDYEPGRDMRLFAMKNGLVLANLEAREMNREMSVAELQALWPQVQANLQEDFELSETGNGCVSADVLGGLRCCMFQTLGTMRRGGLPVELVMYTAFAGNTLYELDLMLPQKGYFAAESELAKALESDVKDVMALKNSLGFIVTSDSPTLMPDWTEPEPTPTPALPDDAAPTLPPSATPLPIEPEPTPSGEYDIPQYKAANATLEPIAGTDQQLYTDLDRGFSIELPMDVTIITPDQAFRRLVDYYLDEPAGEGARRMEAWLLDSLTYETTLFLLPENAGMVGVIAQPYIAQTLEEMEAGESAIVESMASSGYQDIARLEGVGSRYVLGGEEYYLLPVTLRLNEQAAQTVKFLMFARCEGEELHEINLWQTEDATDAQRDQLVAMTESVKYTGVKVETKLNAD